MSISSNINLATQHRNAIRSAASSLEGTLEAPISVTNINVSENIRNTVSASNRSANEEAIYNETLILDGIDFANLRIWELTDANSNWFRLMSAMPEDALEMSRLVNINQNLINEYMRFRTQLEENLRRLNEICDATGSLFVRANSLFDDVNAGLEHIGGAWNGRMFIWNVDASWRTNLQNAWEDRRERNIELAFQQEKDNLRAMLQDNRDHLGFAQTSIEEFEDFILWEIENLVLLREMMPSIENFEQTGGFERSPWADFVFLTDASIFFDRDVVVDIVARQAILEELRRTGSVDANFLQRIIGLDEPPRPDYVGMVMVSFNVSRVGLTFAEAQIKVLEEGMQRAQGQLVFLGLFCAMRLSQKPTLNTSRVGELVVEEATPQ